jgi:hypothetical protein
MSGQWVGIMGFLIGAALLGGLAYLIGVRKMLYLLNNYTPEKYPDADGLGRWMGVSLAIGALSMLASAAILWAGSLDDARSALVMLAGVAVTTIGVLWGLIRFHRRPAPKRRR